MKKEKRTKKQLQSDIRFNLRTLKSIYRAQTNTVKMIEFELLKNIRNLIQLEKTK